MSRIGKLPIGLPSGVNVSLADGNITVRGPKGQLSRPIVDRVSVNVADSEVQVERDNDERQSRANHGLMRSLISNMVQGVHEGFTKQLQVIGVGYRADVKGKQLVMNLGFSHPIEYPVPDGIEIQASKENIITVSGIDKQQVGQVAAEIRGFRKPDSYKGKGVRYVGEHISLKAGKSAK